MNNYEDVSRLDRLDSGMESPPQAPELTTTGFVLALVGIAGAGVVGVLAFTRSAHLLTWFGETVGWW